MFSTSSNHRVSRFGRGGGFVRSINGQALDNDAMRAAAPSIFAEEKHGSRSDKFTYIPTSHVLDGLRREGFMPFEVRQGGSKDAEKRGFTKHMIRLRHASQMGQPQAVGDSVRELVLVNAHDGTSSYQLINGIFRLVCSNGLIVADGDAVSMRVPHKGDIVHDVIEGAYRVIGDGETVDAQIDSMRALTLHADEQEAFAVAARELKYEEGKGPDALTLNKASRAGDEGADLWRTFNRVQESMIRGGDLYADRNPETRRTTWRRSRPVQSVDGNVGLNRALWRLAAEMAKLKGGAAPVAA